jgi:hypothetical protein
MSTALPHPHTTSEQPLCADGDALDLGILWRQLRRWGWLLLLVPGLGMAATAVLSYRTPKIHEVSMTVKIGVIGTKSDGSPLPVDAVNVIKANIETGAFNAVVAQKSGYDPSPGRLKFKVVNPSGTEFLVISSEWEEDRLDEGKSASAQLVVALQEHYGRILAEKQLEIDRDIAPKLHEINRINAEKMDLDQQIAVKQSEIGSMTELIRFFRARAEKLAAEKTELLKESKRTRDKLEGFIQPRNKPAPDGKDDHHLSALMNFMTTAQQFQLAGQIDARLNALNIQEENARLEMIRCEKQIQESRAAIERLKIQQSAILESKIDDVRVQIEKMRVKKSQLENIRMVDEPRASPSPLRPKTTFNIALAGVAGLTLALAMAFLFEYLRGFLKKAPASGHGSA